MLNKSTWSLQTACYFSRSRHSGTESWQKLRHTTAFLTGVKNEMKTWGLSVRFFCQSNIHTKHYRHMRQTGFNARSRYCRRVTRFYHLIKTCKNAVVWWGLMTYSSCVYNAIIFLHIKNSNITTSKNPWIATGPIDLRSQSTVISGWTNNQ